VTDAGTDAADDGWFTFNLPPYGADGVHAHARRDDAGRWWITDLYVHGQVSAETLRGISIPRLEARLAQVTRDPDTAERMSRADDNDLKIGKLRSRARDVADHERELRAQGIARAELRRPDGEDPEEFYRLVSRAYAEYAAETKAPAREMAEEAGVPVTTVHRWVREARRRGFLPPARKGRAG
jgi:hypothetical protein